MHLVLFLLEECRLAFLLCAIACIRSRVEELVDVDDVLEEAPLALLECRGAQLALLL